MYICAYIHTYIRVYVCIIYIHAHIRIYVCIIHTYDTYIRILLECVLLQIICHGIPDCRPIADGDVVNLDVTVYVEYKGKCYHGDLNEVCS